MEPNQSHSRLGPLVEAFNDRRDQEAIGLARTLLDDPEREVRLEAKRILASCLFTTLKYEEACPLWLSLVQETDEPNDWLSVVTSLLGAKRFDEADRHFPKALEKLNEQANRVTKAGSGWVPGVLTGAHLLHYYAHAAADAGAPERSLPKIRELAMLYAAIGVTDDHFLIIRGLMGFGAFINLLEKVYPLTRREPVWPGIFRELLSKLDDEGKTTVQDLQHKLK